MKKSSRNFVTCKTSPDILVTQGKNSVANVTVLVAISSPDRSIKQTVPLGMGGSQANPSTIGRWHAYKADLSLFSLVNCYKKRPKCWVTLG